ncbi:MAG: hypothetical protein KC933_41815, partial [Myxococcales bacterium]|nr:hypothetical protein [Myxococcales bacterium]
ITQLSNHLRSVDPYDHPITISWTRPDHPSMELSVPHVYQRSNADDIDLRQADALVAGNLGAGRVYPKARYPMPIIAGEIGEPFGTSSDANFELNMRVGSRIKLWSAFFNEAGLVLWESSLNNAQANGGVTFLSPELRQAFAVHQTFAAAMTADVVPVAMSTLQSGSDRVRVYQLKGASTLYGYLLHPNGNVTSPTTARGFTVQLDVPRAGTLRWVSPVDGAERGSSAVQAGLQSVAVPEFDFDLAFSLTP